MLNDKITILCTRPLEPSLIQKAEAADIVIESVSFIKTEFVRDQELTDQLLYLSTQASNMVFTSMNAAESVGSLLQGRVSPVWKIFCMGYATKKIVQKYFGGSQVNGQSANAFDLADEIIDHPLKEVIFFCGDQRREELPEKLAANNVTVKELVVYKTLQIPQRVVHNYNGILFFSPSAVESFFSINSIPTFTILFAIGSTTANSIRKFSNNEIIISELPGKNDLVDKAITYFDTIKPYK